MSRRTRSFGALFAIGVVAAGCASGGDASISLPGLDGAPAPDGPARPTLPPTSVPQSTAVPVSDAVDEDQGGEPAPIDEPIESATTVAGDTVTGTTVVVAEEPPPDEFLRRGDEGPEVASMQRRLIVLDYLAPGGDTGVFDGATADALIDFQAQYGLIVDGIFGPQTDRALNAAAASVEPG